MRIDANGALDTKYVDEDNVTIKNTADNCNDVVVVDDNQVDKVKNTLKQAEMQGRINDPSYNQTLTTDIKSNYPSGPQAYVSYSAEIYFGITGGTELSSSMGNISLKGSMPAATIWGEKTEISNNVVSTNFDWFGKGGEFKTKFGGAAELGGGVLK